LEKEYLYVGHYNTDTHYVLKVGTTNNLERRRKEHCRNYHADFVYDWTLPLSHYNTLRYEDKTRERWKQDFPDTFKRNDRFFLDEKPDSVSVVIRKEYRIDL